MKSASAVLPGCYVAEISAEEASINAPNLTVVCYKNSELEYV
jgi:hypothetical protein